MCASSGKGLYPQKMLEKNEASTTVMIDDEAQVSVQGGGWQKGDEVVDQRGEVSTADESTVDNPI